MRKPIERVGAAEGRDAFIARPTNPSRRQAVALRATAFFARNDRKKAENAIEKEKGACYNGGNDNIRRQRPHVNQEVRMTQSTCLAEQRQEHRHYPAIRLFVSSAFLGMEEERRYFNDIITPKLRALCRDKGVSFSAWICAGASPRRTSNGIG